MTSFDSYLNKATQDVGLSAKEMADAVTQIMDGKIDDASIASLLTTLHNRGETADEITGAAKILRSKAKTINAPEGTVDCCGTGGDGLNTFNISTAVALVLAACGIPVAKHGNRAASSRSGAADVLEHCGVRLDLPRETLERALADIGFCFLMAPNHHHAMKYVAPVRKSLAHRTIFNLLGPLANPASTKHQLIGVYDHKWIAPIAQALQNLGTQSAMVVHGEDGLDEISLSGATHAAILKDGHIIETVLTPDDFGIGAIDNNHIIGGDAATNAAALLDLLNGKENAYRSIVLANAAAVLRLRGLVHDLPQGVTMAAGAIESGKALSILNAYKDLA